MNKLFLFITAIFFFGCTLKQGQQPRQNTEGKEVVKSEHRKKDKNTGLLEGVWGYSIEENASFRIMKDSMYFLEDQQNPVPIIIKQDTLVTDFGGFTTSDIIQQLTNDSLILINELGDTLRLVRIASG